MKGAAGRLFRKMLVVSKFRVRMNTSLEHGATEYGHSSAANSEQDIEN